MSAPKLLLSRVACCSHAGWLPLRKWSQKLLPTWAVCWVTPNDCEMLPSITTPGFYKSYFDIEMALRIFHVFSLKILSRKELVSHSGRRLGLQNDGQQIVSPFHTRSNPRTFKMNVKKKKSNDIITTTHSQYTQTPTNLIIKQNPRKWRQLLFGQKS